MSRQLTRDELLALLNKIADLQREEGWGNKAHDRCVADDALLSFIGDPGITAAYERIEMWTE